MQMFDLYKTSGYFKHFCKNLGLLCIKNIVPLKSAGIICTKVVTLSMFFLQATCSQNILRN